MRLIVQKYLQTSTIHGFSYMTSRYHLVERIFWILTIILSMFYTSVLIVELAIKVWNFPIVTYMSDQSIPVSEINFPAVTVCPRLILDNHRNWKYHLRQRYEKHTLREIFYTLEEAAHEFADERRFGNISYVEFLKKIENGSIKPEELSTKTLKSLQVVDLIANRGTFSKINFSIPADSFLEDINEFYKEFMFDFDQLTFHLFHTTQEYASEIITQWGLCFTFNIAFSHDLLNINTTSDDFHYIYAFKVHHYSKHIPAPPPKDIPIKVSTSQKGLWVGFGRGPNFPMNPYDNDFDGYLVLLHDPLELPSKSSKNFKFNRNLQTKILVEPKFNSIDDSLLDYELNERNCYLENEKILKFFKFYTKNNCESECLSDFVLSRCGCVEFFMIRNLTTEICRANQKSCFKKAEEDFQTQISSCKCFEPCEYVKYEYEMMTLGASDIKAIHLRMEVGFQVQYKIAEVIEYVRKKQFTILDFISFVGGILGLFAGFSALSFVEIIYWFGIRVFIEKYTKADSRTHPKDETEDKVAKTSQLKSSVKLYFTESSVHGVGYFLDSSWVSRILWILFILISMTFCLHLILSTREVIPESRVIAFDDNFKNIENSKILFPAITIVPQFSFKSSLSNVRFMYGPDYATKFETFNETNYEMYKRKVTRYFICWDWFEAYTFGYNFSFVPYIIDTMRDNSEYYWFYHQFSALNEKYLPQYAEVRTPRGMGFTFNIIDAEEMFNFDHISSDFNYSSEFVTFPDNLTDIPEAENYPLRFNKSNRVAFTARFNKHEGEYTRCIKQSFLIHHSDQVPTFTAKKDFMSFEYGTTVDIIVTPEITRTDKSLKKLKPIVRGCYFDGERTLHFFKKYSQKNCEIECLANLTLSKCGCVDIDQPFKTQNDICLNISRRETTCINDIQSSIYISSDLSPTTNCECLPLCNSINYIVKYFTVHEKDEVDKSTIAWQKLNNEATINVKMDMDEMVLYRRYQQFTSSDVVSYVGGLLGLFAGISMLSIVEFFYFFTVRLAVDLWRKYN